MQLSQTFKKLYFKADSEDVKSAILLAGIEVGESGEIEGGSKLHDCTKWEGHHLTCDRPNGAKSYLEILQSAENSEAIEDAVALFEVVPPKKRKAS